MNLKQVMVSFIAIFAILAVSTVSAIEINDSGDNFQASVKGLDVTPGAIVNVFAGETIPVKVAFLADSDASDVRVKVWISGYKSDIMSSTDRFEVIEDTWYSNLLSLSMPEDVDPVDDLVLVIRIEDKSGSFEREIPLKIQRESFNVELISVDADSTVTAGNALSVDVIAKNRGSQELEDLFVVVRVPTLGIEKKIFFGDLDATDEEYVIQDSNIIVKDSNREDAAERRISLTVPENAKPGVYSLEATAYNSDVIEKTTRSFVVLESKAGSDVLTATTSKEGSIGQEMVFDLILVNKGTANRVYEIVPEVSGSLTVNVDEPIVSISGDSSKVVKVRVIPGKEGTYTFGINVNSEGDLVKRVGLTVNAAGQALNNSVVVLTVVLAIIFVVLLVVLIVLLTRKPAKEVEESYY